MNKNYNKAKEIYERWYHSIDMMPYDVKQEFFSYNIPSDIISSWHNEYIKELYSELMCFFNSNPNFSNYNSKYFSIFKILLHDLSKDENNYEQLVVILENFYKYDFLSYEMKKHDTKSDYFFKLCLLCNKDNLSQELLNEIYFKADCKYCGFIDTLLVNNYIHLYNRLMFIICKCIEKEGIFFQFFIKDLLDYLKFKEDFYHLKEVEKSININKEKYPHTKSEYLPDLLYWEL